MADRPIIFSSPMILAVLDGRKTQTRRIIKLYPSADRKRFIVDHPEERLFEYADDEFRRGFCNYESVSAISGPYPLGYAVGDRLWVRENHYLTDDGDYEYAVCAADTEAVRKHLESVDSLPSYFDAELRAKHRKLRPSIHMPRWASRLTLTVTDVRVQRLWEISKEDVIAEGITERDGSPIEDVWAGWHEPYAALWESLHGKGSWDVNPWIVGLTFSVARGNIDALAKQVPA